MDKLVKPWRLAALFSLVAVLTVIFLISLYRLQIVDGADYYAQSQNSIVTRTPVVAARGNLLDRYGRALTSTRVCNNLSINTASKNLAGGLSQGKQAPPFHNGCGAYGRFSGEIQD